MAHPDEQRASRAQPPCERDLVRVGVRAKDRFRLRLRDRVRDRVRLRDRDRVRGAGCGVQGATDSSMVACTGCAPG